MVTIDRQLVSSMHNAAGTRGSSNMQKKPGKIVPIKVVISGLRMHAMKHEPSLCNHKSRGRRS